jgi:zinc protease
MRRGKTFRGFLAVAAAMLVVPLVAGAQVAKDWREIQKPPLPPFQPQQPIRVALPNGMVLFLQENRELPLISGTVMVRGGSREEPAEKAGLVSLYGEVWRTGGTKTRTGDELDDYLEARAAKVETGGSLETTSVSFSCLKEDFEDVFQVFVELLREPAFREDKLPLAKNQLNTSIARRNDDPWQIAGREARKLVYGADSPYARVPEYETVAAVTRDDLVKWHQTYVHPNNMILGVSGDFDAKKMEAKLKEAFGVWPKGPAAKKLEVAFQDPKPGYYLIEKEDVNQSNIRMVHLGTRRDNPDYFALEVLNEFFGGGFTSRLFSSIRTKRGLAYAAGGVVGSNFDYPGVFNILVGTKSESTAEAISAVYEEIDNLYKTPATPEELQRAKDAILNSFVFRFDTKGKVLRERMTYEFYGYPADFLERYRAAIEKVTIDDVARVAKKYIHKDRLAVLVVGRPADFDRPLSSFGPVTKVDITIPEPGAKPAATASNAEGRALVAKVVESLGGSARVREVRALRQKAAIRAMTPQGEMAIKAETLVVYPDRMWQKMAMPFGEMQMVVTPAAGVMQTPMGSQPMPGAQKEESLRSLKRDPIFVAQHADDPRFTFNAAGTEKIGEVEARVLEVNADGSVFRWFLHPETARILRVAARTTGPSGPAESVTDFSEWKTVEGFPFAVAFTRTRDGQKEFTAQIEEIEVNPQFDPQIFEQPAATAP